MHYGSHTISCLLKTEDCLKDRVGASGGRGKRQCGADKQGIPCGAS